MKTENSKWFLVFTKAKEEKRAKENLENQGFEIFLPMIAYENKNQSKSISFEAIFPHYLFIKINFDEDNWISINSTKGVSHLIYFGGKPAAVADETIQMIKAKVDENGIFYPKKIRREYKKGEKLIIKKGQLAGIEAIFLSRSSEKRVRLLLTFLKTTVIADISKSALGGDKETVQTFKL